MIGLRQSVDVAAGILEDPKMNGEMVLLVVRSVDARPHTHTGLLAGFEHARFLPFRLGQG